MRKQPIAISLLCGLVVFALEVMPVYAEHGSDDTSGTSDSGTTSHRDSEVEDRTTGADDSTSNDKSTTSRRAELRQKLEQKAVERKKERLDSGKLKVCESHQNTITSIMNTRVTQAEKHKAVFDKISTRVQTYYKDKNLSVANYDELVTKVSDAKVKAEASLAALKDANTFSCNNEDPKADVTDFKTFHKQLREDLKAYRAAIKDLIVAVKSAQDGGLN